MNIVSYSVSFNRIKNNKNEKTADKQIEKIEDFDRKFLIPMAEYIESLIQNSKKK